MIKLFPIREFWNGTVNQNAIIAISRVAKYKQNILNKVSKDPIVELIENFWKYKIRISYEEKVSRF